LAGDLKELRELLVGTTIQAVDKPDPGVDEAVCKFTVTGTDGLTHHFHLHATGLGWWVGEHLSIREQPDGTLLPAWEDVGQMVEAMTDHLVSDEMADWDYEKSPFVSQDDPMTRCFGFVCVVTEKAWYASLQALKVFMKANPSILDTPEQRRDAAQFLGVNHRLPAGRL
jgi:hypothetical protein